MPALLHDDVLSNQRRSVVRHRDGSLTGAVLPNGTIEIRGVSHDIVHSVQWLRSTIARRPRLDITSMKESTPKPNSVSASSFTPKPMETSPSIQVAKRR